MNWIEVQILVNAETEDSISNCLFELGSVGCSVIDDVLHAYFSRESWNPETLNKLSTYLNELSAMDFTVASNSPVLEEFADKDWNEAWKKSLQPIHITNGLIIKPSWVELESDSDKLVIDLDPQMAFGSGAHATTQLMLKLMSKYVQQLGSTLDIGTGSGILSIAAAKMSDANIVAIDIDPVAVATARANCDRNAVLSRVRFITGNLSCVRDIVFDTILANINRSVIQTLLRRLCSHLKPDGLMILSGIMISERDIIIGDLYDNQLTVIDEARQDEWLGLAVQSEKEE